MTTFGFSHEEEMQALREDRQRRLAQRQAQQRFESDPMALSRMIELTAAAPNASPGLVALSAMSGLGDEQFALLAQQDFGEDEQDPALSSGWWSRPIEAVTDGAADVLDGAYQQVVKPFVRTVFTVSETLAEEVQRPLTAALAAGGGEAESFGEAYNELGPSVGVHALQQWSEGEGFDLGEGFFAGGAAREEQQASRTLEIQGQQANFGRSLVNYVSGGAYEPTDRGYAVVAGVLQFAADVGLDPTTYLTAGLSKTRNVANALGVEDAGKALRDAARAGSDAREVLASRHSTPFRDTEEAQSALRRAAVARQNRDVDSLREIYSEVASRFGADAADEARRATQSLQETRGLDEVGSLSVMISRLTSRSDEVIERRLLAEAGAVEDSARRGVLLERAEQLFRSDDVLERIAQADAYDLMHSFRRSRGNTIDAELLSRLGRATDKSEVADALMRAVARGDVSDRRLFGGPVRFADRTGIRARLRDSKFAGASPVGRLDPQNPGQVAAKLDSFLRQAGVAAEDTLDETGKVIAKGRRSIFNEAVGMKRGDMDQLFNVARDAMRSTALRVKRGTDKDPSTALLTTSGREIEESIDSLTKTFRREFEEMAVYASDEAGEHIKPKFLNDVDVALPMLQSHLLNSGLELPDAQAIRRAATEVATMRKIYQSAGWDFTAGKLQWFTRNLFKPLAILRAAYVVRIGAEEQLRLAGAGFDSLFNHPFRFIQANVLARKEMKDLVGGSLEEQARLSGIISRESLKELKNREAALVRNYTILPRSSTDQGRFLEAWRDELLQVSAFGDGRAIARFRGNHAQFLRWARETPEGKDAIERIANSVREYRPLLTSDEHLLDWADANWRYIQAKTGGDDVLTELVATGRAHSSAGRKELSARLRTLYDDGSAPENIKGRVDNRVEGLSAKKRDQQRQYMDRAVAWLYDNITSKPSSYLARFPAYRQFMVKDLGEMMPALGNDKLRYQALEQAKKNLNLTKKEEAALRKAAQSARGTEGLVGNLGQLNQILVDRAAEQGKDLMFDLMNRSAAQEAFDVVVPFFDAWKEVTLTWSRLVNENPAFFIRLAAGYRSASNQGVFYQNENGETVFAYPGSRTLARFVENANARGGGLAGTALAAGETAGELLTGQIRDNDERIRMEGRVSGLNIAVQGIGPGFGPVVQWATGAFVPDTPDFRTLREFIAPFGTGGVESPGDLVDPTAVASSVMPAWFQKLSNAWQQGDIDEHQWNSTVGQAMSALATSGNYNPNDPRDSERLLGDAERAARWMMFVRGALQFGGPTGPTAAWELELEVENPPEKLPEYWDHEADPDGRFFSIQTLANEYRRMAYEVYDGDHELATQHFLGQYGIEPFYVSQARTRGLDSLPVSTEGDDWVQDNLQFAERHRSVAGYFAPVDGSEDLDFTVWREQIDSGRRQSLTGEQQLALANQTRIRAMLTAAESQMRGAGVPDADVRRALSQFRTDLEDRYPGWAHPVLGVASRENPTQRIESLKSALEDPSLPDTPVVSPLRQYLSFRDAMLRLADERGYVSLNNQASGDLRDILLRQGESLEQRYPEFSGVWRQVLRQEVEA
ncbi:MAG: hypothetical protein ACOC02_01395 [Guyparkeria sp.]